MVPPPKMLDPSGCNPIIQNAEPFISSLVMGYEWQDHGSVQRVMRGHQMHCVTPGTSSWSFMRCLDAVRGDVVKKDKEMLV